MTLLRRHFKTITILLITMIVCLSILLIVDSINDRVNGREPQGFSSSLRQLHPVDVPGMVKEVASRFNGDVVPHNDIKGIETGANDYDYDEDDDDGESASDALSEDDDEDDLGWLYDDEAEEPETNKLEKLNLDPSLVKIKEKMIARQNYLRKECARLGMRKLNVDNPEDLGDVISHKGNLDTLFWNDKFKFIASVIYKSGSGNWRKFLAGLSAKYGKFINFPPQLRKAHYKPDQPLSLLARKPLEVKYRLKHYLKIVTVRHPLIRFLSGYRDKFREHTDKYRKDIPKMIIALRKGDARASGPKQVTFSEFADFVTLSNIQNNTDPHWTPQYIRSRPCQHDYDIIAKLETSDDDMDFIKRVVGIDDKVRFLSEYTYRHEVTNNQDLAASYYKQLSGEQFQRVCEFYRQDFELFGYYRPKNVNDLAGIFEDVF